jgi:hypothetical protein
VNLWYLVEEERFEFEFPQFVNHVSARSTDITPSLPITLVIWETPINV